MSPGLLEAVVALLEREQIGYALIGGDALAAHGVARATLDTDLFTTDRRALDEKTWEPLEAASPRHVDVRRGDADDPLAGVAHFDAPGERPIDLVVGRAAWQADMVARAARALIRGMDLPVATAADLILLKLYAGGPQDAWDVEQLLAAGDRAVLGDAVAATLDLLPRQARALWRQILGSHEHAE